MEQDPRRDLALLLRPFLALDDAQATPVVRRILEGFLARGLDFDDAVEELNAVIELAYQPPALH